MNFLFSFYAVCFIACITVTLLDSDVQIGLLAFSSGHFIIGKFYVIHFMFYFASSSVAGCVASLSFYVCLFLSLFDDCVLMPFDLDTKLLSMSLC